MAYGGRRPTQNLEENKGSEVFRGKTGLEVAKEARIRLAIPLPKPGE